MPTGNRVRAGAAHVGAEAPHDPVLSLLSAFGERLSVIEQTVTDMQRLLQEPKVSKEYYSTTELAEAMGVSVYTVTSRWCSQGRICCEKDPVSGKWRIPSHEYLRLLRGGALQSGKSE